LKNYRQEFLSHVESRLHAEYDRGFFDAWADYMRILPKLEVTASPSIDKSVVETEKGEVRIETKATSEEKETIMETREETATEKAEVERVKHGQSTLFDFER